MYFNVSVDSGSLGGILTFYQELGLGSALLVFLIPFCSGSYVITLFSWPVIQQKLVHRVRFQDQAVHAPIKFFVKLVLIPDVLV